MTEPTTTTKREMDEAELIRFLTRNEWTFAKTLADNPHEYIIRGRTKVGDAEDHDAANRAILRLGSPMVFGRQTWTVYRHGPYRYWGPGHVINRAVENKTYDQIADQYDELFRDEASLQEDAWIQDRLRNVRFDVGTTLDIGAGTGLAARLLNITKDHYVGLDPSERMLLQLKLHHPAHTVVNKSLEAFQTVKQFDRVISLYGALNYCMPRFLGKPRELVRPGGLYFLITYAPGYQPEPILKLGAHVPDFPTDLATMRTLYGPPEKLGQSFLVWTNILHP